MSQYVKVQRNNPCPCGNAKKYKYCCEGRLDWNEIFRSGIDFRRHLSIRGRNIYFVNLLSDALQLDTLPGTRELKDYKAAFTAQAVRKIHEAVMEAWPPDIDIYSVLEGASSEVSGLYIGDYGPEYILRGIVRHSIYANKILVVDPFIYPKSVRDEFNPILEPEQYRAQTLKNANFWFSLLPWIKAGIVEVIRTPADFDAKLHWESLRQQRKKFDDNPELNKAMEASFREWESRHSERHRKELLLWSYPDSYIREIFEKLGLGEEGFTAEEYIQHLHNEREQDPNFLQPIGPGGIAGQMHMFTTGSSYDIARLTASLTHSYLVTDLTVRWREIELDREGHSAENKVWAPFAKAVQRTPLKYLNEIRIEHALILRQEQRLESLRLFLRRVWKDACTGDPFDETNSILLAEELGEQIKKTEEEWKQIDRDLMTMIGTELKAGLFAAGPLIALGHAEFLAAAAAAAGALALGSAGVKRHSFPDKYPAAFFMKLQNK